VRHVIEVGNLAMMHAEDLLEGRCHILQQMEAVGNLGGLWNALPNACGRGFGAVTGHHRDVGMRLEPRGDGVSRPILEDVDGTAACEINDDGAVALAFTPRPIIDANDGRGRPWGRDTLRMRRRRVLRLTGTPWRRTCRAPAAPPKASPVWACVVAHLAVVRAYSGATCGSRSAKVWRRQVPVRQRKRRTIKRRAMGAVVQGKSARVRG
jgi:hypothetical protein